MRVRARAAPKQAEISYNVKPQRILIYMTALASITVVEGVIGFAYLNSHVLRDFYNCLMLVIALVFSSKAIDILQEN